MADISVIVPAYNMSAYIEKCLDSLLNQTKKEIEIIAVDDGSTDSTLSILNKYSQLHPDVIKVISQENGGLSAARNTGIGAATGRYIAFVDSDDYVDCDMLDTMYKKALEGDYDVVACDVSCIYPDKVTVVDSGISFESKHITIEESREMFLNMYVIVCNKLYKKSLFEETGILFEKGIWFEDVLFSHKMFPHIKSIATVKKGFYQYLQRESSITYTYSDKLSDIHKVMNKILDYYKENGFFEQYRNELEYMYTRYMLATYIKRLSKAKDKKKFDDGVTFALETVKNTFPEYKKNIYLNNGSKKGIYLKHFNRFIANLIYIIEKNRMN